MSSILDYKFFLNFKNEGSFGRIEITEPVAFDGASFVVEQDNERYGRDVYRFNEEIDFQFYKGNFDTSSIQQLPNGTLIFNLTQGFDWLVDVYREFKYEANVDFEIELDDIVFIPANLDFQTCETDDYSYFNCKAVQEQGKQLVKRRADIVTDVFSNEDLDGNEVTPAQTQNILLKAKPVTELAKWTSSQTDSGLASISLISGTPVNLYAAVNVANNLIEYSDSSVTYISTRIATNASGTPNLENFVYMDAVNDLSNVVISIYDIVGYTDSLVTDQYAGFVQDGSGSVELVAQVGNDINNIDDTYVIYSKEYSYENGDPSPNGITEDIPTDFELDIPIIQNGKRLYIYFRVLANADITETGTGTSASYQVRCFLDRMKVDIKATGTAIDSVVKGVRYIDVIKANAERINGFDVDAKHLDVGGKYYDNFALTGNLIKQKDNVAFPVKQKDLMDGLKELNMDYQVTDKIYIGVYGDFYPNKEIGAFLTSPDSTFKKTSNERYAINEFGYSYETYEQDRDEENTVDAIHTESQWLTSNKQVENTKSIKVKPIRDAYKLEATRKLALSNSTSTSDDDKMFLLDVVPLAPSVRGGFTSTLNHNIDVNGNVQLLATDQFKWTLIGVAVGGVFNIVSGQNVGSYTIIELDESLIRLSPITGSPSFSGSAFTEVDFPYTNVFLTNRTNEGLVFAENLLNSDNYANLRYSIKRNMETWKPYLATASIDANGTLRNTYFKDNGECTTRFDGEADNIRENADIPNVDLDDAILTPFLYETRLLVPFADMSTVLTAINTVNEDKTIGGFVRCIDNNGKVIKLYPQKLEYIPSTETLTLTGEERNEGDGVDIVLNGSDIIINEVGYSQSELSDAWYEFDGDYLKIYDINRLPVINPIKYDKVTVNGNVFESSVDLMNYLVNN